MRKLFFLFLLLAGASKVMQGQLTYNFGAASFNGSPTVIIPNINTTNVLITAAVNSNGTAPTFGLNTTPVSSVYAGASGGFYGNIAAKTAAYASGTSTYIQLVLTPAAGYAVTLNSIRFGAYSTTTGPATVGVYTSLNNYATPLYTSAITTNGTWALINPIQTAISAAPGVAITVRIYFYGGTGAVAGTANCRIDDFIIDAVASLGASANGTLNRLAKFSANSSLVNSGVTEIGNGNIGIGTSTPTEKLDVLGNLKFSGALMPNGDAGTTTTPLYLKSAGANLPPVWAPIAGGASGWALTGNAGTNPTTNFIGTTDAQRLVFKTAGVEQATILATGNVGIGTSTPLSKLHVGGDATVKGALYLDYADAALYPNSENWINFHHSKNNPRGQYFAGLSFINSNGVFALTSTAVAEVNYGLGFRINSGLWNGTSYDYTRRLTINSVGNVGIGTETPTTLLQTDANDPWDGHTDNTKSKKTIIEASNMNFIYDVNRNNGTEPILPTIGIAGVGGLTYHNDGNILGAGFSANNKLLWYGNTASDFKSFKVLSADNNLANFSLELKNTSSTSTNPNGYWIQQPNSSIIASWNRPLNIGSYSIYPVKIFSNESANAVADIFVQNNKVGIGTETPAAKLDIAGNIKITDGTQGANKVLTSDANGLASWADAPSATNTAWGLQGNTNATTTSFLGTATGNDVDLVFKRNGVKSGLISSSNIAFGVNSFNSNTTGLNNTVFGTNALKSTVGTYSNTAIGSSAMENFGGHGNTAVGAYTLSSSGGNALTAIGVNAGILNGSINLTNATALGANAAVSQSNTLILGSIIGVNGATSNVNVGIGTTTPNHLLHVNGNVFVPNKTGAFKAGFFSSISETDGGYALVLGNNVKASTINTNKIVKSNSNSESAQYINFNYSRGIYFGTGLGAGDLAGTEYNDNANTRMVIDLTGNVGIGTTGPTQKLEIKDGNILTNQNIFASSATSRVLIGDMTGLNTGTHALAVNGTALFTKATVRLTSTWPDYVFEPTNKLPTLTEVEAYIKKHKHLQDVPSAAEVKEKGIDLGDNQTILLKKVEELTLYMIELNKKVEVLAKENEELKKKVSGDK